MFFFSDFEGRLVERAGLGTEDQQVLGLPCEDFLGLLHPEVGVLAVDLELVVVVPGKYALAVACIDDPVGRGVGAVE